MEADNEEGRRIRGILALAKSFSAVPLSGLEASVGLSSLDDCAVIPLDNERDLIIGSDFVRGEDFQLFRKGYLSRRDIGYYLVGANVSDLAAMGASPVGIVVAFRYPPEMTDEEFLEVMGGVCEAASRLTIPLLGGDSGGYPTSVLSAAAIGVCRHGRALLRSGGRAGDILYLTGEVGIAGAALAYFTRVQPEGRTLGEGSERELLEPWRRVTPALLQGKNLSDRGLSRCAIDTSDGLEVACKQMAESSGVKIVLYEDMIPIPIVVKKVAQIICCDPLELVLGNSVDFRLLFSCPVENIRSVKKLFREQGWPLFRIGKLADSQGQPGVYLQKRTGLIPLVSCSNHF